MAGEGIVPMIPSSISVAGSGSSGSINSDGGINFASITSLSINGVFTSSFSNYVAIVRCIGSVANFPLIRLRSSGTDATGSNYSHQYVTGSSTSVGGGRTINTDLWYNFGTDTTIYAGGQWMFYAPALTIPTSYRSCNFDPRSSATYNDYSGTHSLSTSYDGFTIAVASGTINGKINIFGYEE